jgi:hypothetical protein
MSSSEFDEPDLDFGDVYSEPEIYFTDSLNSAAKREDVVVYEIPSIIFIVPYRDREKHHKIFAEHMKMKLQKSLPYKILYVHQMDTRSFNRGAMKNIGFLTVKDMYPGEYQNITLVFNDIDTMPSVNIDLEYLTVPGTIKHFYGFDYTLGGIVSINAADFERMNGFPNFWAWGFEDNLLQIRATVAGIKIDRSVFFKINDPRIVNLVDTPFREVNRSEYDKFLQMYKSKDPNANKNEEGIRSISDLNYSLNLETGFIDVIEFETDRQEVLHTRANYDLRNGPAPFKARRNIQRIPTMKMHF